MYDYFGKGPDSTKVVDYLTAENSYLDAVMAGTKQFQTDLFAEMKNRIKEKDESVPAFKNGYFYYTRTENGKQYYKYCRKKGSLTAPEEILLDIDKLAEGHAYYSASGYEISEDNRYLAFGVDLVSRRQYTIHVKDLQTGKLLPDAIENTQGNPLRATHKKKKRSSTPAEKFKRLPMITGMFLKGYAAITAKTEKLHPVIFDKKAR